LLNAVGYLEQNMKLAAVAAAAAAAAAAAGSNF
jgi:hypothetical protein